MNDHTHNPEAAVRTLSFAEAITRRSCAVVGVALLMAAAAQVRFYVPASPVPVTLQTLVVLLAGVSLGPMLGTAGIAFYLLLGTAGYHVFALGSAEAWGFHALIGPSGGYLLGFLLAQPVLGMLTSARTDRFRTRRLALALLCGNILIFGCGLLWLHVWSAADWARTLELGLRPFVPGLLLKTALAFGISLGVSKRVRRFFNPA